MDIDDIEENLNKFEMTPEKIISHTLNLTVQNNALLKVILNNQLTIINVIDPEISIKDLQEKNSADIAIYVAKLQALLASR